MKEYKNELEHLIYEKCYDKIFIPLATWVGEHPNSLDLMYSRIKYPDTAILQDMILEFTTDVAIVDDVVSFDAVVSCEIELEEELTRDRHSDSVSQKYVIEDNGAYTLTKYAIENLNECALHFIQRKVDIRVYNIFHSAVFSRGGTVYEELAEYDGDKNISIIENAEELERVKTIFANEFNEYRVVGKTFPEIAFPIMRHKKWNAEIFKRETYLDDATFSRIKNGEEKGWSFQTIMSICVGLNVNFTTAQMMLESAGHTFGSSREQRAYAFILEHMRGRGIEECNAFLLSEGAKTLGSQKRKSKVDITN